MCKHKQHDRPRMIQMSLTVSSLSSCVAWVQNDDRQPECAKSPTEFVLSLKIKYHSIVCILLAEALPKACNHVERS